MGGEVYACQSLEGLLRVGALGCQGGRIAAPSSLHLIYHPRQLKAYQTYTSGCARHRVKDRRTSR
jgi:hypothetical protein